MDCYQIVEVEYDVLQVLEFYELQQTAVVFSIVVELIDVRPNVPFQHPEPFAERGELD